MGQTGIGRFNGLPKEIVVIMLGLALTATVGFDLTGSSARRSASPATQAASGAAGRSRLHVASTTTSTAAPATTTSVAPTVPVISTTTPPQHIPIHVVSNVAPAPKPVRAAPVAQPASARSALTIPFGVYVGSGDPSGVRSFAASTGSHPVYAADYLPRNEGWAGVSNGSTVSWITGQWRGSGYTLVLGVPIIPTDGGGSPQGTLAAGAAGQYNSYFATLANSLVSGGAPNAVLRLGWEFNGNWYPWSVTNTTDAANFAAYFRNIVNAMRSVPGQAFKFVWNPNAGGSFGGAYTPDQAYPGSAYVDYVGIDIYDQGWSSPPTPQNAWANQLSQSWGLNWLAAFSAAQGRPIVLPEWGVDITGDGHGMGDDPYFMNQVGSWIVQNNVAWTAYFNFDAPDGAHDLLDGQFNATLAAFRTMFG
jgi:hypothetical protein